MSIPQAKLSSLASFSSVLVCSYHLSHISNFLVLHAQGPGVAQDPGTSNLGKHARDEPQELGKDKALKISQESQAGASSVLAARSPDTAEKYAAQVNLLLCITC